MAKAFIESLCEGPLKLLENGIIGNLRGPDTQQHGTNGNPNFPGA
jgi:hypothetical protein